MAKQWQTARILVEVPFRGPITERGIKYDVERLLRERLEGEVLYVDIDGKHLRRSPEVMLGQPRIKQLSMVKAAEKRRVKA